MSDEGFQLSETYSSYSVPSAPLAPLELSENHYTPNVVHPVAGTRDTYQGGGTEALQYGQGPSYAQTFPSQFQRISSNGSFKQNYTVPVQTYNNGQQKSNAVLGNELHRESSYTAVYQTQQSPGTVRQQTNTANTGLDNAYRHLLRRIIKSLSTEEVDDLCFISPEATSSGVRNKANFSGIVLFKFFEQRRLITAENLEYLGSHLKNINRVDLCHLIDEYTSTHLNDSSLAHSVQFAEPTSHLKPRPPPTDTVPARPPPFNPEHLPTQSLQHFHPEEVKTGNQEYTLPTQVEDGDEEFESLQEVAGYHQSWKMDNLPIGAPTGDVSMTQHGMHFRNSEQLHHHNRQLQTELKLKTDEIHLLSRKNNQLQQSLQQTRTELKTEREILQQQIKNQCQIHKHYLAQIEKLSAEVQGKSSSTAKRYSMRKRPHGIAFIVNNFEFSSTHNLINVDNVSLNRDGSLVDENNLRITWKYLGYKVQVLQNLTASELIHHLMQIALQSHENYDSFVCCILSHGYLNGVYGIDWEQAEFKEIFRLFQGNFCPTLVDKPKLFFIQACRGSTKDKGVSEQKDGPPNKAHSPPIEADFLFGYASPPGYASWRSPDYGSWYISTLCEVFVDDATRHDLLSLLTMVTEKVSEGCTDKSYKQCPTPDSRLRKQVWFFGNLL